MTFPNLLSAGRVGDLVLPNKMIMSPMTRFRVDTDGVPTPLNAVYYTQRASAGLIISESVYVSPYARWSPRAAGMVTPAHVKAWRGVTDAVHRKGGRMFAQLAHGGRISHPALQPDLTVPVAPSAISSSKKVRIVEDEEAGVRYGDAFVPRALEITEIQSISADFRSATARAADAGFDGVELHAGSGFLHHQFLATCANQRSDAYGGLDSNRCRFLLETLQAMSDVRGSQRVGVKIAPNFAYNDIQSDSAEIHATYTYLAHALSALNLAYVHVQYPPWGLFTGPKSLNPIDLIRPHYTGTLIGAGEFDRQSGEAALQSKRCDFIAYGRRFIANPDLPNRFALDAPENGWDESKLYAPTAEGFTDYPTL